MEIESVKCECCGLKEDCTQDYISEVKSKFGGKWLCGLCSEDVNDEAKKVKKPPEMDEAVKAHMLFCRKDRSNPAIRVADGMKQLLRRRSAVELHVSQRNLLLRNLTYQIHGMWKYENNKPIFLLAFDHTEISMNTSRITLRPFKLTDVDDFLTWASDDQVIQPGLSWDTVATREEALNFIKDACIPHPWRRSICIDHRSIGFISVFPGSDDGRSRADMGYAIAKKYWGQGITTMAVKMAVPLVFKDFPHLVRLQAYTTLENKASQRVLEKVGFVKEGILRKYKFLKGNIWDLAMYSLLSTDPLAVDPKQ
ncbi:Protein of unknown function DUF1677, plant [Dillenia turbinata]|uniref:N-acetyltransferase domain-containing protein n=1 Tax=Dillenia turbinata TaxID=194707 RepID=A0AAN8UK03_9MAGN